MEYNGSYRNVDYRQTNAQSEGILWPNRNIDPVSPSNPGGIDYDNYSTQYWLTESESQVHELRFTSDQDERLRWTTGLFHFNEDQRVGYLRWWTKGAGIRALNSPCRRSMASLPPCSPMARSTSTIACA